MASGCVVDSVVHCARKCLREQTAKQKGLSLITCTSLLGTLRRPAQGPAELLPAPIMFSGEAALPVGHGETFASLRPGSLQASSPYDET